MDTITHLLFTVNGKEGKISVPRGLSADEIEHIWEQLDAIKTLVKAQSLIAESKPK